MSNNNSIVPYENPVSDMNFIKPKPMENSSKAHITRIVNAYSQTAYFDNHGVMWIEASKLAEILRTNKQNAQYILSNHIPDDAKQNSSGKVYVRGYEIKRIIDRHIQEEGLGTRKQYLKYSEDIFNAIRDCDTAENIRNIYQNQLQGDRKKLKSKRIKKYAIKFDELTGKKLKKISAEFSHIRSYALFRDMSDNIENGLIVNKDTHKLITKKGINDEEELLELCKEMGFNTSWYERFRNEFNRMEV